MASIVISDSEDSEGFEPFPVVFKTATTKPYRDEPSSTANGVYTDGTISNGASERHRENHVKQARSRKRKKDPEEELDKIRERERKKQQKAVDQAIRKATQESRKETRLPEDRLKQMVVVLDTTLSESAELMAELAGELGKAGVEYRVRSGGWAGSVQWKRRHCERTVDHKAQITEMVTETNESDLLVTLEAEGFAGLVYHSKQHQQGLPLAPHARTVSQYVKQVRRDHKGMRVSLAIEGMDTFFRGKKTRKNREFRDAVLGTSSTATASSSSQSPTVSAILSAVTWTDAQEAIVSLQLEAGCVVRLCSGKEQLAEYIFTLTKAISEKPFRKESIFSFHPDSVTGNKKKIQNSANQVSSTWKHQLMQLNNMSEPMASAVVAAYPSPAHLLSAYSCLDKQSAEQLLKDVVVRRGVGSIASTSRLGPVQSQRIHCLLTATDPHMTLT